MNKISLKGSFNGPVKTNSVLQFEAVECGAASLKIILNYFKRYVPLATLREECGISRDGVTALQLRKAAESYEMKVRAYKSSTDKLITKGKFPSIIHWEFNHFLVIEGFDKHNAFLNDPANGRWRVKIEEFRSSFTGVVLELSPNENFKAGGQELGNYYFLPKLLEPYKSELPMLIAISIAASVPELFIAGATSEYIDGFLGEGRENLGIPIIWITSLSIAVLLVLITSQKLFIRNLGLRLVKRISLLLYVALFSMPYKYFAQRMRGELSSRLEVGFNFIEYGVDGFADFILSLGSGIFAFIAGVLISPILSIITITVSLINTYFALKIRSDRKDDNYKLAMRQGENSSAGMYMFQSVESVKASGLENESFINWAGTYSSVIEETKKLSLSNALVRVLSSASGYLLRTTVILVGGLLIIGGSITVGELMGFQFIMGMIQEPLNELITVTTQLQYLDGEMGRVNDIITEQADIYARGFNSDNFYRNGDDKQKLSGRIEIQDLKFKFNKNTDEMFNGLSLAIESGTHLSIVGASGSGKSTLLRVIAGLYSSFEGKILYDNKTWLEHNPTVLSRSISLVAQDSYLFSANLEDNITLWDTQYTKSQVICALNKAQLLSDLGGSEAISMNLGEGGVSLSGGQKQRVELARSLLRNPSIMLLDEATSALDMNLEKEVIATVKNLNITLISVSHRMYSSKVSDLVLVLDKGKVVQYGRPSELEAIEGEYRELLTRETRI